MIYNVFSLADTPTPNMWSCTKVYRIQTSVQVIFSYQFYFYFLWIFYLAKVAMIHMKFSQFFL
jgi:hypothetical protein